VTRQWGSKCTDRALGIDFVLDRGLIVYLSTSETGALGEECEDNADQSTSPHDIHLFTVFANTTPVYYS